MTATANTFAVHAVEPESEPLADCHAYDAVRAIERVAEAGVRGDAPPWSPVE